MIRLTAVAAVAVAVAATQLAMTPASGTIICDQYGEGCVDVTPSYAQPDPPPPPERRIKRVGEANGSGSYAIAETQGSVDQPAGLSIRVTATPRQLVDVVWTVDCTSGNDGKLSSGSYSIRGTGRHSIQMTVPHPDTCDIGALATLHASGKLRVETLASVLVPSTRRWLPIADAAKIRNKLARAEQDARLGLQRAIPDKDCVRVNWLKVQCGFVIGDVAKPPTQPVSCRRDVTVSVARRGSVVRRHQVVDGTCAPDPRMSQTYRP